MDTIYAEATPPGRGGVAVLRISGTRAAEVGTDLAGTLPPPRQAGLRALRDGGEVLDRALVLYFPAGASFTGEAVVEFHLHGAPVIARRVIQALAARGLRLAEAGEFTRRAFIHGRMALVDVEGLGDLLAAETEAQRRLAMRVAEGDLAAQVAAWREGLIEAGALVMASIDFADEDVPDEVPPEVQERIAGVVASLAAALRGYPAAERLRAGFTVAVVGPPNAGKSSLMNALAGREVAIVSPIAGTTRDVIEFHAEVGGMAVTFLDTAGLREAQDEIESIGIARARSRAAQADLRIHLDPEGAVDADLWREGDLAYRSKADAGGGISAHTGAGIEAMMAALEGALRDRVAGAGLIAHQRQADCVRGALAALAGIEGLPSELLAERLREAATALDRLIGKLGAEDYLDVVFSRFCIGK